MKKLSRHKKMENRPHSHGTRELIWQSDNVIKEQPTHSVQFPSKMPKTFIIQKENSPKIHMEVKKKNPKHLKQP